MAAKKSRPKTEPKVESPDESYDRISQRIDDAVREFNAALQDASENKGMTVGLSLAHGGETDPDYPWKPETPARLAYWTGHVQRTSLPRAIAVNLKPRVWRAVVEIDK